MVNTHLSHDLPLHLGHRLLRLLGRGNFGEVWEAESPQGDRVALKFLPFSSDQAAVHELRALQLVGRFSHPHLIRVDKVWSAPGYLVLSMELADGSLADLLDAYLTELKTALPPEDLCPLLTQAAAALDFLNARRPEAGGHLAGVQHCDVKPGNLLLFGETVKLSDFGLASRPSSAHQPHHRAGTPAYAAPEVFQGQLSDRADQFSLAVSYFELRTGRLPFAHPPRTLDPAYVHPTPNLSLLPEVERPIVARGLALSPEGRWPSCGEMMARLAKVACRPCLPGAGPVRGERREAGRCGPSPETSCRLLGAMGRDQWRATVLDISPAGARLRVEGVDPRLTPGQVLSLVLMNRSRGFGRVARLRVTHSTQRDRGGSEAGGTFESALDQDALAALAAPVHEK